MPGLRGDVDAGLALQRDQGGVVVAVAIANAGAAVGGDVGEKEIVGRWRAERAPLSQKDREAGMQGYGAGATGFWCAAIAVLGADRVVVGVDVAPAQAV